MSLFDSIETDCTKGVTYVYNIVYPSKICRACLLIDDNVNFVKIKRIYEIFADVIGIEIDQDDIENNWLCNECFNQLSILHTFRSSVQQADDYLKSIVDSWWNHNYKGHSNKANIESLKDFDEARKKLQSFKRSKSHCSDDGFDKSHNDTLDVAYTINEESLDDNPTEVKVKPMVFPLDAPSNDDNPIDVDEYPESPPPKRKSRTSRRQLEQPSPPGDSCDLIDHTNQVFSGNLKCDEVDDKVVMIELNRSDALKEFNETAKTEQYLSAKHKCTTCFKTFSRHSLLWKHGIEHDEGNRKFECFICHITLDIKTLKKHEVKHMRRFKCTKCDFLSMKKTLVLKHYSVSHLEKKIAFECPTCHKSYTKSYSQKNHNCLKEKVKCEECGRLIPRKSFANHVLTVHPDEGELDYKCDFCDDAFASEENLHMHMQVNHQNQAIEPLYCTECEISFATKNGLQKHLTYTKKHADAVILKPCPHCSKKFSFWTLDSHINKEHLKTKKYQCDMCPISYYSKYSLAGHIYNSHKQTKKENHICETCGRIFKHRRNLLNHVNIHTGERPYKCALCPKAFTHDASLFGHHQWVHLKTGKKKREDRKKKKLDSQIAQQKS